MQGWQLQCAVRCAAARRRGEWVCMADGRNGETGAPAHDLELPGLPCITPEGRRPKGGEPQLINFRRRALARAGRAHEIKTGDLFFNERTPRSG